jgi:hypothetical protein
VSLRQRRRVQPMPRQAGVGVREAELTSLLRCYIGHDHSTGKLAATRGFGDHECFTLLLHS